MSEIKLIKPLIYYADEIIKIKEELIDTKSDFAGFGDLYKCKTELEWINIVEDKVTNTNKFGVVI